MPIWRLLSRWVTNIFYTRFEVTGNHQLPTDRGVIICINHVNALVDPVVVQASNKTFIRPLARSGLWKKLWLRHLLNWIGAVPL